MTQNGIKPGIIAVVNSQNVKSPQEMFNFFIDSNLQKLAFNHASGRNSSTGQLLKSSVDPIEYSDFIKKIFDLWLRRDDPEIEIRQIRNILQGLLGGKYRSCEFAQGCNKYFTVEHDGNIYPCDCSDPNEEIYLGNIRNGIRDFFSSKACKNYRNTIKQIRHGCLKCKWYKICRGGCTRDYYLKLSNKNGNYFCEGLKEIYQHIYDKLKHYGVQNIKIS